MNSLRTFLSILKFTARSILPAIWLLPAMSIALVVVFNQIRMELNGFATLLINPNQFLFPVIIGVQFFNEVKVGVTTSTAFSCIPFGEFILARPILRTQAYLPRIVLYFTLMLAAPVVDLALSARQPDMKLSFRQSATQDHEAAERLALYQGTFANSRIIHNEKNAQGVLVIPFGFSLVAGWRLAITVLLALAIQSLPVLNLPKKIRRVVPVVLITLGAAIPTILIYLHQPMLFERAFLFFAGHVGGIAVLTLALALGVQRWVLHRVEEMEVMP